MGASVDATPGRKKRRGITPEINITPLVDVVLVLLIIFMVVAPQLEAGESVELPAIENADPKPKGKLDSLVLTYTLSGRYLVEKESFTTIEDFRKRLEAEHAKSPSRRIQLKGDERQEFGKMRELFKLVADIGFPGVSLVVSKKPGTDDPDTE